MERAVLVDHGDGGDLLLAHQLPRTVHGDGGIQTGRAVKLQVAHLGADILDEPGRVEMETLQHTVGLVADRAQVHRHVLLLAQGVFQGGESHGGNDGVGIRVAVAGHIDLVHTFQAPFSESFPS